MYSNVLKCTLRKTEKPLQTKDFSMFTRVFDLAEKERFELYYNPYSIRD